jgi:hypothetical protein
MATRGLIPEITDVLERLTAGEEQLLFHLHRLRLEREALGVPSASLFPQSHESPSRSDHHLGTQQEARNQGFVQSLRATAAPHDWLRPESRKGVFAAQTAQVAEDRLWNHSTPSDTIESTSGGDGATDVVLAPRQWAGATEKAQADVQESVRPDVDTSLEDAGGTAARDDWAVDSDENPSKRIAARRNYDYFAELDQKLAARTDGIQGNGV